MAFDCRKIDSENRSIDHVCECEYVRLWYGLVCVADLACVLLPAILWLTEWMTWYYWFVCADGVSAKLLEFRKEVSLKHCWYMVLCTHHTHTHHLITIIIAHLWIAAATAQFLFGFVITSMWLRRIGWRVVVVLDLICAAMIDAQMKKTCLNCDDVVFVD